MASFNIPAGLKTFEMNLSGFLGVDFSSSMTDIDKRRTPNGYNFVNNNGTIEKRNGYEIISNMMSYSNMNGIWNIDAIDGEFFVMHLGNKLCEVENFNGLELDDIIYQDLEDVRSKGIIINSKLLIFDGKRAIVHDLQKTKGNRTSHLDETSYIPTTQIARSPDGLKSQSYEQVNLISDKKINLFTSTETDTVYQLEDTNTGRLVSVEIMDENGEFQPVGDLHIRFTYNYRTGQITFQNPIGLPPVDGRDNVRVTYIYTEEPDFNQINHCTIVRAYGYGGANNRVFLSGNPSYPNLVMWSDIDNPTYFPAENVLRLGLETVAINEMLRTNDGDLVALKPTSDTDSTAFYVGYAMYNGQEWFPLKKSIKGEGNIGKYAYDTLIDEPLILTQNGVFALNTGMMTDEKYLYHRSYYIDAKLKQEKNLEEAVGISFDGKYYLAINNHVYVADSRYKSNSRNSKYSNYQYEWYYWTDIPVRTWFVWNNELYFGHKFGHICKFRKNDDEHRFWDGKYHKPGQVYIIGGKEVKAEWNTPILDLNNPAYKKNIKRIAIQSNPTNSKLTVGYRLKGGDKQVISKEYINSTYPKTTMIRKKAKKLSFFSLYIENDEDSNMSFNSVDVVYTVGSFYKGD